MQSQWPHEPVWFHGDIAPGTILLRDGRLAAVIDFGTCGVGDPACALAIAWTYFTPHERRMLAAEVAHDADTWARARGWGLWKAAITDGTDADRVLEEVLADPVVYRSTAALITSPRSTVRVNCGQCAVSRSGQNRESNTSAPADP